MSRVAASLARLRSAGVPRRRLLWLVGSLALLALLWTVIVGWWLPRFLQPRIEAAASEALGAPLRIERIEIAPWRLDVGVLGLRLGPAEAAWLRIAELRADVSTESLWRLAPVVERLLVREPRIELERLGPGRFNVTPMLEALARRPAAPADAEPARFAVHNIRLDGGSARFVDRVAGSEHTVDALQIGIPFVSNLPSQVRLDVEPLLDAQVNGSRLHVQGKSQPFAPGRPSALDLAWQDLDVPGWLDALAPVLPQPLPLAVQTGRLDLALHLVFEQRESPAAPRLQVGGNVTLRDLQAALPARGLALTLPRLELQGLDLQPFERRAALKGLRLQAPQLDVALPTLVARPEPVASARDRLTLSDAAVAPAASSASQPEPTATAPWQWRLDTLELVDGSVALRHPAWPEARALASIGLRVAGLDARADATPASLALALDDGQGGRVRLDGSVQAATRTGSAKASLADWQIAPWLAPWQDAVPVRLLGGRVAADLQLKLAGTAWAIEQGELRLADLALEPARGGPPVPEPPVTRGASRTKPGGAASPADRLALPELRVSGMQARGGEDGKPVQVQLASLTLQGLDLRALRDERGGLAWLPAAVRDAAPSAPTAALARETAAPSPALAWQLDELRCDACSLAIVDRSVKPAATLGLQRGSVALRKLSSDLAQTIDFELATQVQGGGRVQAGGSLRPQPLALQTRLQLDAVDLRMLQPYLEPRVNLSLVSAKASAAGELRAEGSAREALSSLRWRGKLGLAELRALDQLNRAEFLRFKSLNLDGAALDWRAGALAADFGQVALDDFFARVIINADGRINLRDIVKREGEAQRSITTAREDGAAEAAQPAESAVAPAPTPAAGDSPAPQLRWRGIRLARGAVDFTDNFIRPNYSARLTDIDGEISALAWDDPKPATVRVAGKVDGSAPLEIGGSVHPLGPRLATDITASARGVDITRLSAYAARYAGYGIEKGTLSLRVHYIVKDGQLQGENQIVLDQLTFGDKVDSPNALKLPLQLAVSLLKDRNGVIDLDLPISGSLDDPKFSIGGVIVRVIVNLITKAITAPFSLLASAFGGGGQDLGHVDFAPGSAELSEAARAKLDTLVKALRDRPALKLEATGRADTQADEMALRERHVERLMRAAKARVRGELAESTRIEPGERERWLEAAYKDSDLQTKPRNLVGFAKSLPPTEMEALLRQAAPVGSAALTELANRRGDRVKAYLAEQVAPERVLLSASKLDAGKEPAENQRVVFALK